MLLLSVLALAFVLPTVVTGRIPRVDGVIGGVRSSDLSTVKTLKDAVDADATARTPGKLRVVENSGVCGKCGLFTITAHCRVNNFGRNYTTCLSSVWIWRHRCEREHLVCVCPSSLTFDLCEHFIKRFWFFAARNNPETAPLITWFNGGVSGTG